MLTIVGIPSSDTRWSKTPRLRASDSPSEPLRRASSAAPKSTVGRSGAAGCRCGRRARPGAIPDTSATASSWAGVPYRRAPDGPTQMATGTLERGDALHQVLDRVAG